MTYFKKRRIKFNDILLSSSVKENKRSLLNNKFFNSQKLTNQYLQEFVKNGALNKIVSIKVGGSLNDTYFFKNDNQITIINKNGDDEIVNENEYKYKTRLSVLIRHAVRSMLYFGRGILVFAKPFDDLSQPLEYDNPDELIVRYFEGSIVFVTSYGIDLMDERYYKPVSYNIFGNSIHYSRVVDFTYKEVAHNDKPTYQFAGLSETQLIYDCLMRDENLQKATGNIIDKSSSLFYKINGFKEVMSRYSNSSQCQELEGLLDYYSKIEEQRSLYGATLFDSMDDVTNVTQQITGLADLDDVSISRLAFVTGIPKFVLTSEKATGISSNNKDDMDLLQFTLQNLQIEHLEEPINKACDILGIKGFEFKENQKVNPIEIAQYENTVINNAVALSSVGADSEDYLAEKGITNNQDEEELSNFENDEFNIEDIINGNTESNQAN